MNLLKTAFVGLILIWLSGCEDKSNTDKLCASNPELDCDRLNTFDGQCRNPRTDLIWHRYETLKDPSNKNKILEYKYVSLYRKCLSNASQIQTFETSPRAGKRVDALMYSGEEQVRLVDELRKTKSPEILYFLWSQLGDEDAKREFLLMEETPALDTAEMQYALATFYTNRDLDKTIILLNRSLELSDGDEVNREIFKSLASLHYQLRNKEQAYIWAKVAEQFDVSVVSGRELQLLYGFNEAKYDRLDEVADRLESAINSGKYRRQLMPNKL